MPRACALDSQTGDSLSNLCAVLPHVARASDPVSKEQMINLSDQKGSRGHDRFRGYLTHRLVFLHHCRRIADCAGVKGRTGAGRYLGLSCHRALPPDRIIASAQRPRRRDRGQFGLGGASATTGTFRIGRKVRWRWDGKHTSIPELRSIAARCPNLRW